MNKDGDDEIINDVLKITFIDGVMYVYTNSIGTIKYLEDEVVFKQIWSNKNGNK